MEFTTQIIGGKAKTFEQLIEEALAKKVAASENLIKTASAKEDMKEDKSDGLTEGQKKLPKALQDAILAKKSKKDGEDVVEDNKEPKDKMEDDDKDDKKESKEVKAKKDVKVDKDGEAHIHKQFVPQVGSPDHVIDQDKLYNTKDEDFKGEIAIGPKGGNDKIAITKPVEFKKIANLTKEDKNKVREFMNRYYPSQYTDAVLADK